jgi:putative membrane protein insertion efficiency factor
MKKLLLLVIKGYQLVLSSVLPSRCRFYPSCSQYSAEAIEHHGVGRGLYLSAVRLSHCHPFHPGGYDPVPESLVTEKETH